MFEREVEDAPAISIYQTIAKAERTALGPTCYRVCSSVRSSGVRVYDLKDGTSGHLTEENRCAGLDDLDLQVDRGGRVPHIRIDLDIELAQAMGDISPDGYLP